MPEGVNPPKWLKDIMKDEFGMDPESAIVKIAIPKFLFELLFGSDDEDVLSEREVGPQAKLLIGPWPTAPPWLGESLSCASATLELGAAS